MEVTIRVYGLLIENEQVLLSRENIHGEVHTKFPGGGLEPGEGILECLVREFREEAGIEISNARHFYTTEDFFMSAFHDRPTQVICIYYTVRSRESAHIRTGDPSDTSRLRKNGDQVLYWCDINDLGKQKIELPIDKIVVQKISQPA